MAGATIRRLQPIDLLKICGDIEYEWDLRNDHIEWDGPFNRLISPEISLDSGSSFSHLLCPKNFEYRLMGLIDAFHSADPYYSVIYALSLPNFEKAYVLEEGKIVRSGQTLPSLQGYLRFIDPLNFQDVAEFVADDFSGYDSGTGLPTQEVLFEQLASIFEQFRYGGHQGLYITLALDHLVANTLKRGITEFRELFIQLPLKIRALLGRNATIGRLSSSCLGIILPNCKDFNSAHFLNNLSNELQSSFSCKVDKSLDALSAISIEHTFFPDNISDVNSLMHCSEKQLFDKNARKDHSANLSPVLDNQRLY